MFLITIRSLTFLALFLPLSPCLSQTAPVLELPDTVHHTVVQKPFLHQLANEQPQQSLMAVRQLPVAQWHTVNSVNFGRQGSPGWVMFQLQSSVEQTIWMELESHFIDSVQVWLIREPGLPDESIHVYNPTGFRLLTNDRDAPTQHPYFLKPLHLDPHVRYAVYIRGWVPPADVLKFDVSLWQPTDFWRHQQRDVAGWALFVGLVLMSVFITLVSYIFHPRRIYLYYCGYILCMSSYALLNDGWGMFLPSPLNWFDTTTTTVYWLIVGILFLLLFTRTFLVTNVRTSWWWLRLNPVWLLLLLGILTVIIDYGIIHNRLELVQAGHWTGLGILAVCGLLWLGYVVDAIRRRFRPVWLYIGSVLAWLFFYVTNLFVVNTGWMTDPFPDMLVFRVAVLAEIGFIFVGWMYRQRIIRESQQQLQGREQVRQQALREAEHNRQAEELKALRLQNELQQQRERLARDLHDGIGSQLTHIAGRLDILSVRGTNDQDQLQRLGLFTRETNQALRDTVWILNRSEIQLSVFAQRLHTYLLRLWEDIDKPRLDWHTDNPISDVPVVTDPVLSPVLVQSLFRIAQEAVNNALKYAKATTVSVRLTQSGDCLSLTIVDDGVGFDTDRQTNGYGLTNMAKRANEVGGQCILTSNGAGTRIDIRVVLKPFE